MKPSDISSTAVPIQGPWTKTETTALSLLTRNNENILGSLAICKARIERLGDLNPVFNYWIKDIGCFKYFRYITLYVERKRFTVFCSEEKPLFVNRFRHQNSNCRMRLIGLKDRTSDHRYATIHKLAIKMKGGKEARGQKEHN